MKVSRVMDVLSYITDVSGARLTNSPNIRVAKEWAKWKLTEWGLQNAHLEAWGPFGRGWSLEAFTANIVKPHYFPLIAFPKAWSPGTNGVVRGQPVYFEVKTEADLDKYKGKLKGAIVLLSEAREVKARYEPLGHRQTDEDLLRLANAEPAGFGGPGGPGRFRMTDEQRAALQLANKKRLMLQDEGAAAGAAPGRSGWGTILFPLAQLHESWAPAPNPRQTMRD